MEYDQVAVSYLWSVGAGGEGGVLDRPGENARLTARPQACKMPCCSGLIGSVIKDATHKHCDSYIFLTLTWNNDGRKGRGVQSGVLMIQ